MAKERLVVIGGILRAQRDMGLQSRLGVVYTGRFEGAHANHVGGLDARLVQGGWTLNAQAAGSGTLDTGTQTNV